MADAEQTWRRYRRNFQGYLKLEKGMASNSVDAYLRDVDHLMRFAIENDIEPECVTLDYLQQLLNRSHHPAAHHRRLANVLQNACH